MSQTQASHLRYVDGLRAVAVLAVVWYHTIAESTWAWPWLGARMSAAPAWWLCTIASEGSHGVDLFFVISGFCLAYPTLSRLRETGAVDFDVRRFAVKRLVRILPPFYAAFALFTIWMIVARSGGAIRPSAMASDLSPLDLLRGLLFLDRSVGLPNGSFWTLSIEFRWYLVFPLVLALYVRSQRAFVALLIACVAAYNFTTLRAIDVATLPAFMLGIVAADWRLRGNPLCKHAALLTFVALDVALVLNPFASSPSRFGTSDTVGFYVQTNPGWQLASFFFVVCAGTMPTLRAMLSWRPMAAIGVAAYSIYLVHQPLIDMWSEHWGRSYAPFAGLAGAIGVSLAGGALFWIVFERTFVLPSNRDRLIALVSRPVDATCSFAGIPERFRLVQPHVAADAVALRA